MSDVREEIRTTLNTPAFRLRECEMDLLADAILERFDVTPKPAVSDEDLGGMVYAAYCEWEPATQHEGLGERTRWYLNNAGLKIVRIEDES